MLMKLCPTDDFTCPYYDGNTGRCELETADEDCDDYSYAYGLDD